MGARAWLPPLAGTDLTLASWIPTGTLAAFTYMQMRMHACKHRSFPSCTHV